MLSQDPDAGFFTITTFDVAAAAEDIFEINFQWLEEGHLVVLDEAGGALPLASVDPIVYNKTTRKTTITLDPAHGGTAGDEVIIKRATPIPADLDDFVKLAKDSEHGTTLTMGVQPVNLPLVFMIQEVADRLLAGSL